MAASEPQESGSRATFLARLRRGLATPAPENPAHPPPPPSHDAPPIGYRVLAADTDLAATFERIATDQAATVHRVAGSEVPVELLERLVVEHRVRTAVVSAEPEAVAVGERLAGLGVDVAASSVERAAAADLGVTSAVAAVAATGSLVLDVGVTGSRAVSLLPAVHLCVLPEGRLVATPGDVLRPLAGRGPDELPSNLVLISGPSRTGDIEQLITLGVHGPVAVHVVLTTS